MKSSKQIIEYLFSSIFIKNDNYVARNSINRSGFVGGHFNYLIVLREVLIG